MGNHPNRSPATKHQMVSYQQARVRVHLLQDPTAASPPVYGFYAAGKLYRGYAIKQVWREELAHFDLPREAGFLIACHVMPCAAAGQWEGAEFEAIE